MLFYLAGSFFYSKAQNTNLEQGFLSPPAEVRTSVYWYWMSGNISKEGVIKDLEAMKKAGINRAFIGNIYFDPYKGGRNVKLMSEEWWEITHAALKRASELNIEIGMFNSPGWSQAGGPWVKPAEAMRYLSSSELKVTGPLKIESTLKKPNVNFQDVRVLAYKISSTAVKVLSPSNAIIKVTPALPGSGQLTDGKKETGLPLPKNEQLSINFTTKKPFTARSISIYPSHSNIDASFDLQVKTGKTWRSLSKFKIDWHHLALIVGFQPYAPTVISLRETLGTQFRLLVSNKVEVGGIDEIELSSMPKIENYAEKTFAKMFQDPLPLYDSYLWRAQPESHDRALNINPKEVLDISKYMSANGTLKWNVPAGEWLILRTGMVPTGVTNNPGGPDGTGLEIDKMSKKHVKTHFNAFIGKILDRIPAADRKTFKIIVQDSYESGGQNFTDNFLSSFEKKYGYSAIPFLPAYFGKVVESQSASDRFLWDLRRLIADKVAYDYVGGFREISHQHGMTTWLENYGHWGFPSEFLMYGGQSDEIGGEYWLPGAKASWENNLGNIENRAASSAAHIYGKQLVSAESNTSGWPAFSAVPADTKQRMDKYFSEGINNTLLHVFVHQPDTNRYPGTNAWFGTEFNRNNTWFSQIDLYIDYIRRCNFMLRQGINIADVAYFIGEDTPKMTGIQDPALPEGYQFDYINAEVLLLKATVEDGKIVLPHGTAYRLLVLPKLQTMRPELLKKISSLVEQGAIVLGPPPNRSPSLQNQPASDRMVRLLAKDLWKGTDGIRLTSARFGKGMIFNGASITEVFAKLGITPDCDVPEHSSIKFGHRNDNGADIYFLSNQSASVHRSQISFRVKGMQPELWNPIDGSRRLLKNFKNLAESTTMDIELDGFESVFIVFRKPGIPHLSSDNFPKPVKTFSMNLPWTLTFDGKLTNPKPITMSVLQDLSKSSIDEIKYFSGNINYTSTFDLPAEDLKNSELYLDLAEVHSMAKIWVNDVYQGGVWTLPYRVKLSSAAKAGRNSIRIEVVNTWVNRLIGDRTLPEGQGETWSGINPYKPDSPLPKSGLLGPVKFVFYPTVQPD